MNDERVGREMRELRDRAERATREIPLPDVNGLIARASGGQPSGQLRIVRKTERTASATLVPRMAAAAAIAVVAFGVLAIVAPPERPAPGTSVVGAGPDHIVALVNDLYDETSYIHTEIAPRWVSEPDEPFLDDVWGDVFDRLVPPGD